MVFSAGLVLRKSRPRRSPHRVEELAQVAYFAQAPPQGAVAGNQKEAYMFKELEKLVQEFKDTNAPERLRNAVRLRAIMPTIEVALQALVKDMDWKCRVLGTRITNMGLVTESFDFGNSLGIAYEMNLERIPNAEATLFIVDKYRSMARDNHAVVEMLVGHLNKLLRCRTAAGMKKRAASALDSIASASPIIRRLN